MNHCGQGYGFLISLSLKLRIQVDYEMQPTETQDLRVGERIQLSVEGRKDARWQNAQMSLL